MVGLNITSLAKVGINYNKEIFKDLPQCLSILDQDLYFNRSCKGNEIIAFNSNEDYLLGLIQLRDFGGDFNLIGVISSPSFIKNEKVFDKINKLFELELRPFLEEYQSLKKGIILTNEGFYWNFLLSHQYKEVSKEKGYLKKI